MAYTIGARHILTGSGSVAIASPIGLKVSLAGIPSTRGRTAGTPIQYAGVGQLALGNADGWLPALQLSYAASLFYPLPDGMVAIGYSLSTGVTATVDELVAVAVPGTRPMPWDRNPSVVALNAYQQAAPPGSTLWTYVVPTTKILLIESAFALLSRVSEPTTRSISDLNISLGSTILARALDYGPNVDLVQYNPLGGGQKLAFPGQTVSAIFSSSEVGGIHNVAAALAGYTFDL